MTIPRLTARPGPRGQGRVSVGNEDLLGGGAVLAERHFSGQRNTVLAGRRSTLQIYLGAVANRPIWGNGIGPPSDTSNQADELR